MDGGTLKDYLEDVIEQRNALEKELEKMATRLDHLLDQYQILISENRKYKATNGLND
jgi:hypothetical protein